MRFKLAKQALASHVSASLMFVKYITTLENNDANDTSDRKSFTIKLGNNHVPINS